MKRFAPLVSLAMLGACASEAPPPHPDPAKIERLLASLQSCIDSCQPDAAAPANETRAGVPMNFDEKVRAADRLMPMIETMPAERIEPSVAVALIAG